MASSASLQRSCLCPLGDLLVGPFGPGLGGCWKTRRQERALLQDRLDEDSLMSLSLRDQLQEVSSFFEHLGQDNCKLTAQIEHARSSQGRQPQCIGAQGVTTTAASASEDALQACREWLRAAAEQLECAHSDNVSLRERLRRLRAGEPEAGVSLHDVEIIERYAAFDRRLVDARLLPSKVVLDDRKQGEKEDVVEVIPKKLPALEDAALQAPTTHDKLFGGKGSLSLSSLTLTYRDKPILQVVRHVLKPVVRSQKFKIVLGIALSFALFANSLSVILNVPDNPGIAILDTLMTFVMILFSWEVVANCIVDQEYPLSFFFFMDMLGTVSMVFEITWLLGTSDQMQDSGSGSGMDTVLLRTARAAKVGARVGRLSKVIKCLSLIYKGGDKPVSRERSDSNRIEAKVISHRLMFSLSTKVSLLTILLVLLVPLLSIGQYPEGDLSFRAWGDRLEEQYAAAYKELEDVEREDTSMIFSRSVSDLKEFYDDVLYYPLWIAGFPVEVAIDGRTAEIPGQNDFEAVSPTRAGNVLMHEVTDCLVDRPGCNASHKATLYFDFRHYAVVAAVEEIMLVVCMVLLMMAASFGLSKTIDMILVKPLEGMLSTVDSMASEVVRSLKTSGLASADDSEEEEEEEMETEVLAKVLKKLASLSKLALQANVATEEEIALMDKEERGVLRMMSLDSLEVQGNNSMHAGHSGVDKEGPGHALDSGNEDWGHLPARDDWDLDVLGMDAKTMGQIVQRIFFDSQVAAQTGRTWIDKATMAAFIGTVQQGYNDVSYHCFEHAADVVHSTYWMLAATKAQTWMQDIEMYAILIAALCHDLGHFGRANPFLVETQHSWAITYNDTSPLENMHAFKLFEICAQEETSVFKHAGEKAKKQARKVCIEAILHTDLAKHFDMVKEIGQIYELNSPACDAQAASKNSALVPEYEEQVLKKSTMLWLELFLHLSDVGNPLKKFSICEAWAHRVLDEFFEQGDEEKRLGLPVGMLNNRETVSRPGSQHGFINFLVSPLVLSAARVFHPFQPLARQLASNVEDWRNRWVEEADPLEEDIAKKDADVQKLRLAAQSIAERGGPAQRE